MHQLKFRVRSDIYRKKTVELNIFIFFIFFIFFSNTIINDNFSSKIENVNIYNRDAILKCDRLTLLFFFFLLCKRIIKMFCLLAFKVMQ